MLKIIDQFGAMVAPEVHDEDIDLLRAALIYARTEYPELDIESYVQRIESLAQRVRLELRDSVESSDILVTLNRVLFQEEGFSGNRDEYYDPRNSYLNEVLDRKIGI